MATKTRTGHDAIAYASAHGLTLSKYTDPIEEARTGLTVDEAHDVAAEDPSLIYLTVDDGPQIIRTASEARQIAEVLHFPMTPIPFAHHINWDSIARKARALGVHFEARTAADGAITVTLFWAYTEDELS